MLAARVSVLFAVMLGCLATKPALPHDTSSCAELSNDIARLECYDSLQERSAAENELPHDKKTRTDQKMADVHANWERQEERDAISDRRNVSYFALPTEDQRNRVGGSRTVFLQLRCSDNVTAVALFFDDDQRQERLRLAVRLDNRDAEEATWSVSSNRQAAGLWRGNEAIPFIRSLIGTEQLGVRVFLDNSTDTYIFRTTNIRSYAADIADACNWTRE